MRVPPAQAGDRAAVAAFLGERGWLLVVRRGELVDALRCAHGIPLRDELELGMTR